MGSASRESLSYPGSNFSGLSIAEMTIPRNLGKGGLRVGVPGPRGLNEEDPDRCLRKGRITTSACLSCVALARGACVSADSKEKLDEGLENIGACLGLSQR